MSSGFNGPKIRRIVTGHDGDAVAQVMTDDFATNAKQAGNGAVSTLIWCTDGTPADIPVGADYEDMGARIVGTQPPANGVSLRGDRVSARRPDANAPHRIDRLCDLP